MALILNIETSSPVCSVCLSRNGELISEREDNSGTNHASLLVVFIRELLTENNLTIHELDAVAVSAGPGSYTGLRIGVATAKGICFSISKPLIAVDSLHALAAGMIANNKIETSLIYCPTIDARRNEIYYSIVDQDLVVITPSINHELNSISSILFPDNKKILIGGSGVAKCLQHWNFESFAIDQQTTPSSKWMIPLSEREFTNDSFENVADFEPAYIKPVHFTTQKKSS